MGARSCIGRPYQTWISGGGLYPARGHHPREDDGVGDPLRHFPNREALVVGVYRKQIDALVVLAPKLLATHPPLQAFRQWCDRLAKFGRTKHGVADVLRAATMDDDFQTTYGPRLDAVRQLMDACERSGAIKAPVEAQDFLVLVSFLWQLPPEAGEGRAKKLLALVFRGLGAEP